MSAWRRLVPVALLATLALVTGHAKAQETPAAAKPTEFTRAEFVHTGELPLPPATANWEPVQLPDSWRKQNRARNKIGWYRIRFTLAALPATPQAIYIPRITNNVAVHVNDVLIGVSGQIEARELSWNTAQLFFVPPALLRAGAN